MADPKRKVHKLVIKPRPGAEDQISTGANTEVFLDGKRLGGCRFVKFEAHAKRVTKVTLEVFAQVECEANVILEDKSVKDTGATLNGKPMAIHQVGTYAPVGIAINRIPTTPSEINSDESSEE